jgi:protein phosphatase
MICAGNTDIGMKRASNQDTFVLKTYSEKTCLCVVCDGMGGAKGGSEASRIASEKFASVIDDFITPYIGRKDKTLHANDVRDALLDAVEQANNAVYQYAQDHSSMKGMGTTLVAALVIKKTVFAVNVGDSRMYFMKGAKIKQITKDHSYVQHLLDLGQITEKEAATFPNKNIITRAVGVREIVEPDYFEFELSDNDVLLLCTDGLSNLVDDQELLFEVVHGEQMETACERLLAIAKNRGAPDNVTCVLAQI